MRDAAVECLEEVYAVVGEPLVDIIARHGLRPAQLREIYARLGQSARAAEVPLSSASAGGGAGGGGASALAAGGGARDTAASRPADQRAADARAAAAAVLKAVKAGGAGGGGDGEDVCNGGDDSTPASPGADTYYNGSQQQQQHHHQQQQPAPAAAAPPKPKAAPKRRGGFGDGGGVGVAGELPDAPALYVATERELHAEMDRVAAALTGKDAANDWQRRIGALLRLEGLVKGGAAAFPDFDDTLRGLRDALAEQMLDRRSAVSRQVCHLLAALSAALGPRFDATAAAMLPLTFKVVIISVQVMADAADACARALARGHKHPKVLAAVCDALTGDKNAKLRERCSFYLLEASVFWDSEDRFCWVLFWLFFSPF